MERWKHLLEALDIPGGSMLGVFTTIIIGLCVWAVVKHFELPSTVVDTYKFVVMSFAGSKAVQTVWGKPKE